MLEERKGGQGRKMERQTDGRREKRTQGTCERHSMGESAGGVVSLNTFNIQKAKHQRQNKAPSRVPGHRSLVTAHWCWTQGSCAPLMAGVACAGPSLASLAHSANLTEHPCLPCPGDTARQGDAQRPVCDLMSRGQLGVGTRDKGAPRGSRKLGTARLVETRQEAE